MQRGAPSGHAALRSQAAPVIEQREANLSALIAENPSVALRLAFTDALLADLAAKFPQSAALLERRGAWQGPVEYIIEDGIDFRSAREIRRMHTEGRVFEVHFAGREPSRLKCGDLLAASGVMSGNRIAAEQATVTQETELTAACSTIGEQRIAVILVNFPGASLPANVNADLLRGIFLGNGYTTVTSNPDWSISDFWYKNSDSRTWVASSGAGAFAVAGPYLLSQNYDYCSNSGALRQAAYAAADADLNYADYSRVVIVVPNYNCSGTAGVASLGCWSSECPGDGVCGTSWTWWRADQMNSRSLGFRIGSHEIGHNLLMSHASSRDFGAEAVGAIGVAGTLDEYGDRFSTMGFWNFGFYSAQHAVDRLGWMTGSNYTIVTTPGTFSLPGYDTQNAMKALKVRRGTNEWFWIAYYPNNPIYLNQLYSQIHNGAIVHYQDASTPSNKTHLIDFTPNSQAVASEDWKDPALVGSWSDPYSNLSISVGAPAGGLLPVTVSYGVAPCTTANPVVTLAPASATTNEGTPVNYTVTVQNNDSSSCAERSFSLASALSPASGLVTMSFSPQTLTIAAGAGNTSTLTVSPGAGSVGSYTVTATASSGASSGSNSAGLSVTAPPPPPPAPPAAPSGLTAAGIYSGSGKNRTLNYVRLSAIDNANNETLFRIQRCTVTGKGAGKTCTYGADLTTLPPAAGAGAGLSYNDATAVKGTPYRYRVRAENSAGESAWVETSVNP